MHVLQSSLRPKVRKQKAQNYAHKCHINVFVATKKESEREKKKNRIVERNTQKVN